MTSPQRHVTGQVDRSSCVSDIQRCSQVHRHTVNSLHTATVSTLDDLTLTHIPVCRLNQEHDTCHEFIELIISSVNRYRVSAA